MWPFRAQRLNMEPARLPEAEEVFLRAALLAEAFARASECQGKEEAAEQQREAAAKMRSLLQRPV